MYVIFTHLKLCLATHNFKCLKFLIFHLGALKVDSNIRDDY